MWYDALMPHTSPAAPPEPRAEWAGRILATGQTGHAFAVTDPAAGRPPIEGASWWLSKSAASKDYSLVYVPRDAPPRNEKSPV